MFGKQIGYVLGWRATKKLFAPEGEAIKREKYFEWVWGGGFIAQMLLFLIHLLF
jgi:hypothetical protein